MAANTQAFLFYRRWIWANAWSELAGLGGTFALGFLLFSRIDDANTGVTVTAAAFAIVAGAVLEGGVVGFAQARVIRAHILNFCPRSWIQATIVGAGIAWLLGMVPSTAMSLMGSDLSSAPAPEPQPVVLLVLAAGMGAALGPVLSFPQYFVLKRSVEGAGWWIAANALAWAIGMVVIFAGIGTLPAEPGVLRLGLTASASCLGAGALVGTLHGPTLLRLTASASGRNGE